METTCRYDIKGFSNDLGLSLEDIFELYCEFIKELNLEISKLGKLLITENWDEIKKSLHNIKGVSVNYRITDIYEETVKIYNNLNSQKYDEIYACIENLTAVSNVAIEEISKYFAQKGLFI